MEMFAKFFERLLIHQTRVCHGLPRKPSQNSNMAGSKNHNVFLPGRLSINHESLYNPIPHTLWQFNIAMENGPVIVDLPIKSGDFQ